jgi:hypothetical protein
VGKNRRITAEKGQVNRLGWRRTIDGLSTRYRGLSEPALQTEIYHLNTMIGKIHTEDSAAGGIGVRSDLHEV